LAPRSPDGRAAPAAGPRALADDGALEDVPEIGEDLALPPEELDAWVAAAGAARDLDAELGVAGTVVATREANGGAARVDERREHADLPDDDDPNARTVREGGALAAAALAAAPDAAARVHAPVSAPGAETAVELALEVRGPEAGGRAAQAAIVGAR
jgi:hypothetical protein